MAAAREDVRRVGGLAGITYGTLGTATLFASGLFVLSLTLLTTQTARAHEGTFRVVMTKVVCDQESDLPNIGIDGPDITSSTAKDWVKDHPTCRLAKDWHFQWANDPTPDPGSNSGEHGDWQTFGPSNDEGVATVEVPVPPDDLPRVWFREVWSNEYIPFTHDRGQGDNNDVSAELYCHDDVWNYDNYDFVGYPETGETYHCVAWNVFKETPVPDFVEPRLEITKTNNVFPNVIQPGDDVTYTLTITAPESNQSDVLDVTVTDLPPEGFIFEDGTDHASSDNADHQGPLELDREYASPGVWNIGTLEPGETVTLSYVTEVSDTQDPGLYKDLAWAEGRSEKNTAVLANASSPEPFVGTKVEVDVPVAIAVALPTVTDTVTKVRGEHIVKRVLGASTLPLTGATTGLTVFAAALLLGGMALILFARRLETLLSSEIMKTVLRILLFLLGAAAMLMATRLVYAAEFAVRMETPQEIVSDPDFKIGFVVLDIEERAVTVRCLVNGTIFETHALAAGGNSGDCQVTSAAMPADGSYEFQVRATIDGESLESETATVELIAGAPGTPTNYSRTSPAACQNELKFRTADDEGKTVKVEVYRSTETSFTADDSTKAGEVTIGSSTNGSFLDTVADCGEKYFYALRAVSEAGAGSAFVGDTNVKVKTRTKTKRDVDIEVIPGSAVGGGALAVTGAGSGTVAGAAEDGEETPGETAGDLGIEDENGEVLGETVEDEPSALETYLNAHPFMAALALLVMIVLGYSLFQAFLPYFFGKKNGGV